METDFCIRHSFWRNLDPRSWTRGSLIASFLAFYCLIIPVYFFLGFQPSTSVSAVSSPESSSILEIPSLSLSEEIIDVRLEGDSLDTPPFSVGRYIRTTEKDKKSISRTFLFGHSTTVFSSLKNIKSGAAIILDGKYYLVENIADLPVEEIDMRSLLAPREVDSIVLMTCSGEEKNGKYPKRLLIEATRSSS